MNYLIGVQSPSAPQTHAPDLSDTKTQKQPWRSVSPNA